MLAIAEPTVARRAAWELDELRPDPAGASPLYLQIVERIAAAIACGRLKDGEALPPERILSERLEVSRTTVRKALDELTARGLVTSRHGSGNFVATRLEQPLARLSSFSEDMRARGRRPGFVWVERGVFAPSPEEVIALALGSGEQVARFVRVRLADDEPLAIERAAIAARDLPEPDGGRDLALCRTARRAGSSRSGRCSICAPPRSAPPTHAHLGIPVGSPVMATVRYGYLADAPPGRVHALGLSRRPLRFRRRDAPRLSLRSAMDQTSTRRPHPHPRRLDRRHLALHGPDPGDRARPGARRPVHRAGLHRPPRAWRPRRRLHGRRRRGPAHGARSTPRHGTTSLLATTVTAPADDLRRAMAGIAEAMRSTGPGRAGPRRASRRPVHQPATRWAPSRRSRSRRICRCWRSWRPLAPIRVATYAPEIDPDGALLAAFRRLGTRAQIGHTTCSYAQARAALAAGAAGFTHLLQRHVRPAPPRSRGRRRRAGAGANRPS